MRKAWLFIIGAVVIWGLHAWISEDDRPESAKDLACEPHPAVQAPHEGLPAKGGESIRRPAADRAGDWQAPPFHPGYAGQAGKPPPAPAFPGLSGEVPDSLRLEGYRFRPADRGGKAGSKGSSPTYPAYSDQQFGSRSPPAYAGQQFRRRSPPAYSEQQYDRVSPPAYPGQTHQQGSPAYPREPVLHGYGDRGPVSAGPPAQMRFRPLDSSSRAPRRWTGNYPTPGKGSVPESYGQWAVPRGYEGSKSGTWSPPPPNNLLLYNSLGAQDAYSAR